MRSHVKDKAILIVFSDLTAMVVAYLCAQYLGNSFSFSYGELLKNSFSMLIIILTIHLVFFVIDAYSLEKTSLTFIRQSLTIIIGLVLSASAMTFIFFLFRSSFSRKVFILFYILSAILIITLRYILSQKAKPEKSNVLVVGSGEICSVLENIINTHEHLHSRIVGLLSDNPFDLSARDCSQLGRIDNLLSVVKQHKVDHIILAMDSINDKLAPLLVECMKNKISVLRYVNVVESFTGKIPLLFLDDNWFILELGNSNKRYFWFIKRFLDICIALTGIILALPLFLLAAVWIKLDSRGPVFFIQTRIGRANKPFNAFKLRTMVDGADKNNVHFTLEGDERITRVGKFLRKSRFDEVPQLINILKGEMSLIGPRPEAVSLVNKYLEVIPYYHERHMVSPGITGWAQINYRYGNTIEDTQQKLMYDLYYIKNRGIVLDSVIFLRTIRTVLTCKGAL